MYTMANNPYDNNKPTVVVGSSDSGKTNLAFYIASQCGHEKKYILGYPREVDGYIRISDKDELFKLNNCVIIIDEFQRYFARSGRNHNDALEEAIDFAEHRNIKLILTAQNNQAIDRNLESKIKCWALKRLNVHTLKHGGMCKVALDSIKDPRITSAFLALENSEYVWFNIDSQIGENGIKTFPDMGIKKDWDVQRNVNNVANKMSNKKSLKKKRSTSLSSPEQGNEKITEEKQQ